MRLCSKEERLSTQELREVLEVIFAEFNDLLRCVATQAMTYGLLHVLQREQKPRKGTHFNKNI